MRTPPPKSFSPRQVLAIKWLAALVALPFLAYVVIRPIMGWVLAGQDMLRFCAQDAAKGADLTRVRALAAEGHMQVIEGDGREAGTRNLLLRRDAGWPMQCFVKARDGVVIESGGSNALD